MPTAALLLLRFCTVDDWLPAHGRARRPAPACSASERLPVALAGVLPGAGGARR